MKLYAKLDGDGYINGFSDIGNSEYSTEFEIEDEDFFELSACSGRCFKIEDGIAVKYKEVSEYLTAFKDKAAKVHEIAILKQELSKSDYKAIKYSEGFYTDEEYLPIKQERADLRIRINQLEEEIL